MASSQIALVQELLKRRGELSSDQGAIVDELAKRMMTSGELRPGPPSPRLPDALSGPPAEKIDAGPKGAMARGLDVQPGRGVLDIPPVAGARQMVEGVRHLATEGQRTRGAQEVLEGGMGAASVLLPAAVAQAPLATAVALGTGTLVGGGANTGMRMLGASPETAALVGDVAGIVAGGRTGTAKRLSGSAAELGERWIPSVVPKDPVMAMVKAIKPTARNVDFAPSLNRSLPEVKLSEAEMGRPVESVADMLEAVDLAKKRIWQQREAFAGPQREIGLQIDLTPVADRIAASIPTKLKLENLRAAAAIMETADKYRGKFGVQEVEQFLKETNAVLDSYYAKYPTAQRRAAASNPDIAEEVAKAQALRSALYNALDSTGQGAGPREYGRRYGALLKLEEELYRRKNVADRQQPESLSTQAGYWTGTGSVVGAGVKALTGNIAGAAVDFAKGMAERKASQWIRDQQTTDAIIKATMAKYGRQPTPIPPPAPFRPAGLLGPGPIITPPPPDASYVRGVPAMPAVSGTPRMLPPPSDIITPPPVDSSYVRGVPAWRTAGVDPQTGDPKLAYLSAPPKMVKVWMVGATNKGGGKYEPEVWSETRPAHEIGTGTTHVKILATEQEARAEAPRLVERLEQIDREYWARRRRRK